MIKFFSKSYLIFCWMALFSLNVFAQRIGDSNEKWLMLTTPHFEIFYSAEHQDLGLYYANIAELSYAEISTIFPVAPSEKIVVIINDSTDASNGFTTLLPYPYIMIYPVQVGRDDVLSESAEWAKELFVHELAHVFQLYPAEDFYKFAKPIFGSIVAPNLLMPLWWKEGMAVEIESRFSHQGRTKSYFQDAGIRALVLEKKLFQYTLAEANEFLPTWPYGGRPYLFGSMIMGEIALKNDGKSLGQITTEQGARLPYFLEAPHQRLFGYGYEGQFMKTLSTYELHANNQLEKLSEVSPTEVSPVDEKLISSRHPRFNSSGTVIAMMTLEKKGKQMAIYKLDAETKEWKKQKYKKSPNGDISTFEFHPTENKILFAKIDLVDNKRNFSDLYIFDLDADKEKQLTKSARARNPIWSPDGGMIYFISTFGGRTQLKSFNVTTSAIEQLHELAYSERFHDISWYGQDQLFVSIKDIKGNIQPKIFDLQSRILSDLKISLPEIQHVKNKNGKIYFSSIANGVANIYLQQGNNTIPVSHLLTGTTEFDVHEDEAIAAIHTANGLQVHKFKIQPFKPLPKITNQFRDRYKYEPMPQPTFATEQSEAKSLKYLYPHYWIPFISTSTNSNGIYFQAVTSGQDPLLIHRYNLAIEYDSFIDKIGYNFDYVNSAFNWPFIIGADKTFKPIGTTNVFIEKSVTTLGFVPDTFKLSPKLTINAGMQQSEVDQSDIRTKHAGPYLQTLFRDVKQTIFDIYPTGGYAAFLQLEDQKNQDENALDTLGNYQQAAGSLLGYHSKWLPEDHSIYGKINFLYTKQKVSTRFGTSNTSFPVLSDTAIPDFVLRGYGVGQFFGARMASLNTEYRFPVQKLYKGSGTDPYFLKRVNGAVIVDGLTVTGGSFDKDDVLRAESMNQSFWSTGVEARLETTLGYLLPVNFILGFYQPLSPRYANSGQTALSLQIGGGVPGRINH